MLPCCHVARRNRRARRAACSMEAAPLLPSGDSAIAPSWPVVQPPEPLYIESDKCCKWKYAFSCGCCSFFCYSLLGLVIFALLLAIYPVLVAVLTVLVVLFGWLAGSSGLSSTACKWLSGSLKSLGCRTVVPLSTPAEKNFSLGRSKALSEVCSAARNYHRLALLFQSA